MRRFEYVEGKSSKFWEVDIQGSDVHLAWGRIGTDGQSKVKSFASTAKAQTERDKLIAQKTKKGYVEVGATTKAAAPKPEPEPAPEVVAEPAAATPAPKEAPAAAEPPPELPDEDALVMPDKWKRRLHPRRGSSSATTKTKVDKKKSWAAMHKRWQSIGSALKKRKQDSENELLDRVRALFDSADAPDPADAELMGAVERTLTNAYTYDDKPPKDAVVDFCVASRGYVFATDAAFESLSFTIEGSSGSKIGNAHLKRAASGQRKWRFEAWPFVRLRRLLAEAAQAEYDKARGAAEPFVGRGPAQTVLAAYLFPDDEALLDRALAASLTGQDSCELTLAASIRNVQDLRQVSFITGHQVTSRWNTPDFLASLVEGVGAPLAPVLDEWLDGHAEAAGKKRFLEALSMLPSDEAMTILLDRLHEKFVLPALGEAVDRFPRRGVRLLSERVAARGKNADVAKATLGGLLRRWPAAVDAIGDQLSDAAKQTLATIADGQAARPEAPSESLPKILVSPPWTATKKIKNLVVRDADVPLPQPTMQWAAGDRKKWEGSRGTWRPRDVDNWTSKEWEKRAQEIRGGTIAPYQSGVLFTIGPEALARETIEHWVPGDPWYANRWMPAVISRLELLALPPLTLYAERHLRDAVQHFLPLSVAELAPYVAEAFVRLKSARSDSMAWLERHPEAAAAGVMADAVGKAGKKRGAGEAALRHLSMKGHRDTVISVAARAGDAVRAAAEQILSVDPLDVLPAKIPKLPGWYDPVVLPAPLLRNREHALPPSAVQHLGTMLALSKAGEEYGGLEVVRELCDPDSLSEFAWSVFDQWRAAGMPSKEGWALATLGFFGDDETARRLTPILRKWPGEGGHARAVQGLDVLATIGSDVALMHLHGIAQRIKFKGLQKNAAEKIQQIARARDLTADELADRLVPDLDLDDRGSLTLDYGARKFTVGFDEQLKPFVLDEKRKPLKALPKPGKKDDEELAPAAYKRFSALKKDARTVAKGQILRLELAMTGKRRWPAAQFQQFFVTHPLLIHVVRRLVWATYDDNRVIDTFRVAEDRSLADCNDDEWSLAQEATVGIPHMLELSPDVAAAWGDVFGDYEILQPFTQLGREVNKPTDAEKKAKSLERFKGKKVPTGKVIGLESRGWRRGPPMDGGVVGWMQKSIPGGGAACLNLEEGIWTGYMEGAPEQSLLDVTVASDPESWDSRGTRKLGELDPVVFSEIVRDLELMLA